MYLNSRRLPHLLGPEAYHSADDHAREVAALFRPAWHLVGSTRELERPGDFLTFDLLGHPVHVRNFDGQLRALSNVCAHRHCLLTSAPHGASDALRCQYHGWEYGPDGRTRRIPEPQNFVPFDRDAHRLPVYRVDTCGQLVFVSLEPHGPTLQEQLGDRFTLLLERFGTDWRETLSWNPDYPANWKVAVENSLEAYHVPSVHPTTFGDDPGSERSTHLLGETATVLTARLPFASARRRDVWVQRMENVVVKGLGRPATAEYSHHHLFPNLLVSLTDLTSFCQSLVPVTATTSRAVVRQFGNRGARSFAPARVMARAWTEGMGSVTRRILAEDASLFASIQRGLEHSPHRGTLGCAEERVHAFQQYVRRTTAERASTTARPGRPSRAGL